MSGGVIYYNGRQFGFSAEEDATGKFDPETFEWDEGSYNFLNSIEDDEEYFEWIDGLCSELDKSGRFSSEVYSLHLNY
jgi:hypothetical protein